MEATTCHLKDGSHKFPTLMPIVQYKSLKHGENKNVIDELNNKLI
jgi:hypothetical protein